MQKSHSELVAFAKSRLIDLSTVAAPADLPVVEQRTVDLLRCLDELGEQYEHDRQPHSAQGRSLVSIDMESDWRKGLAPDGAQTEASCAYLEKLEELGRGCSVDPVAFDALALHAASRVEADLRLPVPLRRFVCDHLRGGLKRPSPSGRPRKTALPDLVVALVVAELVESHGIRAVGNVASENKESACAIVAQAMSELGRSPRSFSAIEKVWFASKRDEHD